ncbi:hypothetical protein HNQ77_004384 [Silvibacterium bohemicum]|uniref:Uncharacterized protein n=1 Tax=Silvibacterium bohemicum TaxID=1577686 RepID=A0A841JYI3_9BACT|nr:hypothetical protein [Silvibacterium bohemicum]
MEKPLERRAGTGCLQLSNLPRSVVEQGHFFNGFKVIQTMHKPDRNNSSSPRNSSADPVFHKE